MKVSEFSVKHPVILTMLLIVLMAFGFYSLSGMRSEFMEDISMPQAIVYTDYPGASRLARLYPPPASAAPGRCDGRRDFCREGWKSAE